MRVGGLSRAARRSLVQRGHPQASLSLQCRLLALEEALEVCPVPEIFNTDQGSQFTSRAFTGCVEGAGARISMDGRGQHRLVRGHWEVLTLEESSNKLRAAEPVSRSDFETVLRNKLQPLV